MAAWAVFMAGLLKAFRVPCAALAVVSGLLARRQAVRASSQALKGFRGINRFVSEPLGQAASRPGPASRHCAIYSTVPCPRFASGPHEGTANPRPMKTDSTSAAALGCVTALQGRQRFAL